MKWQAVAVSIIVIMAAGLLSWAAYWNLSRIPPVHVDPHLTISDIRTRADVNGFAGQEAVVTVADTHHNLFSKPLRLSFCVTQGQDVYKHIALEVQPGTVHQLLPVLKDGNTGWWVSAEVDDDEGASASAPARFIHIGDDDFSAG